MFIKIRHFCICVREFLLPTLAVGQPSSRHQPGRNRIRGRKCISDHTVWTETAKGEERIHQEKSVSELSVSSVQYSHYCLIFLSLHVVTSCCSNINKLRCFFVSFRIASRFKTCLLHPAHATLMVLSRFQFYFNGVHSRHIERNSKFSTLLTATDITEQRDNVVQNCTPGAATVKNPITYVHINHNYVFKQTTNKPLRFTDKNPNISPRAITQ